MQFERRLCGLRIQGLGIDVSSCFSNLVLHTDAASGGQCACKHSTLCFSCCCGQSLSSEDPPSWYLALCSCATKQIAPASPAAGGSPHRLTTRPPAPPRPRSSACAAGAHPLASRAADCRSAPRPAVRRNQASVEMLATFLQRSQALARMRLMLPGWGHRLSFSGPVCNRLEPNFLNSSWQSQCGECMAHPPGPQAAECRSAAAPAMQQCGVHSVQSSRQTTLDALPVFSDLGSKLLRGSWPEQHAHSDEDFKFRPLRSMKRKPMSSKTKSKGWLWSSWTPSGLKFSSRPLHICVIWFLMSIG